MSRSNTQENRKLEKYLDTLYEAWKSVRRETIARLGKEDAVHIINFHGSNWIDITKWIMSKYSQREQMNIIFIQFQRLFKEIYWLQFLFHNANYPLVYRNLRYILEMMAGFQGRGILIMFDFFEFFGFLFRLSYPLGDFEA